MEYSLPSLDIAEIADIQDSEQVEGAVLTENLLEALAHRLAGQGQHIIFR